MGSAPKDASDDVNSNDDYHGSEIEWAHGGKHAPNRGKYWLCGFIEKVNDRKKRTT
jgi:hypothetical protein